jgi:GNAT superfamily N-acetyltransferase
MSDLVISGYQPGVIGRITALHANYYSKYSGFGLHFESKVATEMSEFLTRFDEGNDGFWIARVNDEIIGSIAIDGLHSATKGYHLRWYIVDEKYQGKGIGNQLMQKAIDFCRKKSGSRIYLWTISGLEASRHLYEKHGFKMCESHSGTTWGIETNEQMFELIL